jgi:hypothetical protein
MKKIYFVLIFMVGLVLITTGCGGGVTPPYEELPEWTVMVYLDADNNLESAGIDDINEMEVVGSTADVNIVVQVDRIPYSVLDSNNEGYADDTSNGDWTNTRRYYITQDYDPYTINSQLISNLGELNMGHPSTLINFAKWAVTNYPAKKYLLVIWNHGGGFRSTGLAKDIAWDETSGGDKITMSELEYALSAISIKMGKNIDIVGMDACFMAMTEVAYQIKDYADFLVASEESEPNDGWPYDTILAQLAANPTVSPTQLAYDIIIRYIYSYTVSDNVTLSKIHLSNMDTLASQLSDMALAIMNDTLTSPNNYISAALSSQYYGDWDFIDLYDFCNKIYAYSNNAQVRSMAVGIKQTLTSSVGWAYNGYQVNKSRGLSIYFPYTAYDSYYNNTNFAQDTWWDEMLLSLGL